MRRAMLTLCALAIVAPLSAQEPVAAPKQVAPVNNATWVPATPERQGLLSRIFNRNRDYVPMNGNVTPAPVQPGTTMATEPVYDRRGNITGYRHIYTNQMPMTAMNPAPVQTPAARVNPAPMITQTSGTMNMEPVYDRRGRITGYRPMQQMNPALVPTARPIETAKPVTGTVAPMGNTAAVAPNQAPIVQTGYYVETMPEQPRRGLLSRIFRR
jgi:hypothetical protein